MNHYTVTCRVAPELCDCALSLYGNHLLVLTFTNTNSHGSHGQKCYIVFIFHYKNYFCCVHDHCVVTFRAIHSQECYCRMQCHSLVSSLGIYNTAILGTKSYGIGQNPLTYENHLETVKDGTVTLKWILSNYIGVLWAGPSRSRLWSSRISLEYGNIKMALKQIYW